MAQYVVFGAFALFQFLSENPAVVLAVREEVALLSARLRSRPAWTHGPTLDLDTVLGDVAAANRALRRHVRVRGARDLHYALSLTYTGRPRAFLRALRLGRALASVVGDVALDVELRRNAQASNCVATAYGARARRGSTDAEEEEAEPLHVVRRLSLEQLYTFLRPALELLSVDDAADGHDARGMPTPAREAQPLEECSICFAAAVDTVAPCSHAFCADCYERWRRRDAGCALCRAPLPAERGGTGAWVLAEQEAGGAAEARWTAARVAEWLQALPPASGP